MSLDSDVASLLDALQSGLPLTPKPFEELGRALGRKEQDVLAGVRSCMENGSLIRLGPVLDTRAMGFTSSLLALKVDPERMEEVAKAVADGEEVTHCYQRRDAWNLWFTATVRQTSGLDDMSRRVSELPGVSGVKDLRTVKRLKLNARFALANASFGTGTGLWNEGLTSQPEGVDAQLLARVSEGFSVVNRPFREIGDRLRLTEEEVLAKLKEFLKKGWVRRYAGVVSHVAIGYRANALLVREASSAETLALAERLKAREDVSHLYLRRLHPAGPDFLCAMLHARSSADLDLLIKGFPDPDQNWILKTVRCYKRSFFRLRPQT